MSSSPLIGLPAAARAIIEAAPDAMILTDRTGRIVMVNPQASHLFGYPPAELVGHSIEILIPVRYRKQHPKHRTRYFEEPKTRPMGAGGLELFGLRKDGSEFPAEISLSPLETEDGRVAITAIRDVSERRRAEQERARLIQAQEAVRQRDEFLSVAAHELRTPLTAMQLQLQGLQRLLERHGEEATRRFAQRAEKVLRQGRRLDRLVGTLLDVSRVVAGRLQLETSRVDLAALVREVVEDLQMQAQEADCAISMSIPEELYLVCDRFRIEQVIVNLMTNAIKYGAGRPIEVCVKSERDLVIVSVTDQGIGIAPEDAERIFERFERAAPASHYGGMGLGLYISRHLIEAHGGRLSLRSDVGRGASFLVELPIVP
jgi:two-component system, LuxR family, sensor kinase FixL